MSKIETAEEAWKVLASGEEIVSHYDVRFKLFGNSLMSTAPLNKWEKAQYADIGTGPWTVYKEEKKPEPLELIPNNSNGAFWGVERQVKLANSLIERINSLSERLYLLENIDKPGKDKKGRDE